MQTTHISIDFQITQAQSGKRFDVALAQLLPEYSRSLIGQAIENGQIVLNGQKCPKKQKVYSGDQISGALLRKTDIVNEPENIPLDIVYEDDDVLVINKPAGLVVHPGAGNQQHTLLNALLYHVKNAKNLPRAGIVHRLDKETSGLMVVAKTLQAQTDLVRQLQIRQVKRVYIALAVGEMRQSGKINLPIGRAVNDRLKMAINPSGREALTFYHTLARYTGLTLLECMLYTGRTHQIRVHLAHLHHPIVGDPSYGTRYRIPKGLDETMRQLVLDFPRQALHAKQLAFLHPVTGELCSFEAPIPEDMQALLDALLPVKDESYRTTTEITSLFAPLIENDLSLWTHDDEADTYDEYDDDEYDEDEVIENPIGESWESFKKPQK